MRRDLSWSISCDYSFAGNIQLSNDQHLDCLGYAAGLQWVIVIELYITQLDHVRSIFRRDYFVISLYKN